MSGTGTETPARTDAEWLAFARLQLDSVEQVTRAALERLSKPPTGDQAARHRELRRRARIERLPIYLRSCLHQIELTRKALAACPQGAQAVYHALMAGVLSQYPDTADVHESSLMKASGGYERAYRRGNKGTAPPKIK